MTPASQDRALAEFFEPFETLEDILGEPHGALSKGGCWQWIDEEFLDPDAAFWQPRDFTSPDLSMMLLKCLELAIREAAVRAIGKWEERMDLMKILNDVLASHPCNCICHGPQNTENLDAGCEDCANDVHDDRRNDG